MNTAHRPSNGLPMAIPVNSVLPPVSAAHPSGALPIRHSLDGNLCEMWSEGTPFVAAPDPTQRSKAELKRCLIGRIHELERMLLRRGYDLFIIDDAVAETLYVALVAIENGRVANLPNWTAWLRRVALNLAATMATRRLIYVPVEPEHVIVNPFDEAEEEEVKSALLKSAQEKLAQLDPELYLMFEFCAVEGHSYEETARHFGTTVGAVNHQLRKVRGHLREVLCERD